MIAKKKARPAKKSAVKSRAKAPSRPAKKPAKKPAASTKIPPLPAKQRPPKAVTRDYFLTMRAPRVGQYNPHKLSNPVWEWLVKHPELSAYGANAHFKGPSAMAVGPGFCNMRFGQTRTALPDGRVLLIGGEHEDYYDPDFYIYNDVIVLFPSGDVDVYCYPQDAFAPTDHHSATLVDGRVIIIGGLSYSDRRVPGKTLVYDLDLGSLAIAPVITDGDNPGWIFEHTAELSSDSKSITVRGGSVIAFVDGIERTIENDDEWTLELDSMRWTHSKHVEWPQWEVRRSDGRGHRLFLIESMAFMRDDRSAWGKSHFAELEKDFGGVPDFALYNARYAPPVAHEAVADGDEFPKVSRRVIEGVTVRYVEEHDAIRVVFEGALTDAVMELVVEDLRAKLAKLEGAECQSKRLR
jgi:hypothetical protein